MDVNEKRVWMVGPETATELVQQAIAMIDGAEQWSMHGLDAAVVARIRARLRKVLDVLDPPETPAGLVREAQATLGILRSNDPSLYGEKLVVMLERDWQVARARLARALAALEGK